MLGQEGMSQTVKLKRTLSRHVTRQWGSEGEGEGHAGKEDKDTHLGPVPVALNGVSTNHGGHGRGGC